MIILNIFWTLIKFIYHILRYAVNLFSHLCNVFWLVYKLASAITPWFAMLIFVVYIVSKFIRLPRPQKKHVLRVLGAVKHTDACLNEENWPVANRGACYDAPPNSIYALNYCRKKRVRFVLIDVGITKCGELVVIDPHTLKRNGYQNAAEIPLEDLMKINLAKTHTNSSRAEYMYTLSTLMETLADTHLIALLRITDNSNRMVEKLKSFIKQQRRFAVRSMVISTSPILIYQLRKAYPRVICGLFMNNYFALPVLKKYTLTASLCDIIYRNIISPVIGISLVILMKEEFNEHVGNLWRHIGVRPIVYKVNLPNEKYYYQKTLKTRYITDSLCADPSFYLCQRTFAARTHSSM